MPKHLNLVGEQRSLWVGALGPCSGHKTCGSPSGASPGCAAQGWLFVCISQDQQVHYKKKGNPVQGEHLQKHRQDTQGHTVRVMLRKRYGSGPGATKGQSALGTRQFGNRNTWKGGAEPAPGTEMSQHAAAPVISATGRAGTWLQVPAAPSHTLLCVACSSFWGELKGFMFWETNAAAV